MKNEEHTKTYDRISELDAIRGLACLVVCFVHLWSNIKFYLSDVYMFAFYGIGKFAVSIFFILSAYLSTKQAIHGIIPGKFLIKRFVRIYVPFACVAIFGWIIGWVNTKEELSPLNIRTIMRRCMAIDNYLIEEEKKLRHIQFYGQKSWGGDTGDISIVGLDDVDLILSDKDQNWFGIKDVH